MTFQVRPILFYLSFTSYLIKPIFFFRFRVIGPLVESGYVGGCGDAVKLTHHLQGRRDCDFTTDPGPNSCLDGGCNGGLVCDPTDGTVWLVIPSPEFVVHV